MIFSTHILQLAQDLCDEIVLLNHHQLQSIPSSKIHDADFEEEIFSCCRTAGGTAMIEVIRISWDFFVD